MNPPPPVHHLSGSYQFRRQALVQGPDDPHPRYFWTFRAEGPSLGHLPESEYPDAESRYAAAKQWLGAHVFEVTIAATLYRLHHLLLSEALWEPGFRPGEAVWYVTVGGRQVLQFPAEAIPDLESAVERLRQSMSAP
jgi:hypothetical protein